MLKVHTPPGIFSPIGPYAQAIEASELQRWLFVSGTMGLDPDGRLAGDFKAQCHRVWRNIDATLKAADMGFPNLAKLTIWLADRNDWKLGAQIRQHYLGDCRVAMSVVQAGLVDSSWLIEVEAVAVA